MIPSLLTDARFLRKKGGLKVVWFQLFAALNRLLGEWRVRYISAAVACSVLASATIADAAELLPQSSRADTGAGIVAGIILAAVVTYGLFLALAPVAKSSPR